MSRYKGQSQPVEVPEYGTVHTRLVRARGRANGHVCVSCGGRAAQWAYDGQDPQARIDPKRGSPYSADLDRYQPMCAKCHKQFDRRDVCRRGHSMENAYVFRSGAGRTCRTCKRARERTWMTAKRQKMQAQGLTSKGAVPKIKSKEPQ